LPFFSEERFKVMVRYMIQAAQDKRCVPYAEIEHVCGLSHKQASHYAGRLGDYCIDRDLPPLNALLINSNTCIPSGGFAPYQEKGKDWGQLVSDCWSHFHVKSTHKKLVQNFSGIDKDIDAFLSDC
jgi:hypothetical protein